MTEPLPDALSRPLRFAVVGAGQMGSNHLRILSSLKDVELVAVVDPDRARGEAARARFGCEHLQDPLSLVGRVDAVCVASPSSSHAQVAGDLLEHGIHCLIEKPLATTESDCLALIAAAHDRGLVLLVGHVERFNPVVQQLERVLGQATVHAIDVRRMSSLSARITDIDVVGDLMVHDIDIVLAMSTANVEDVVARGVRTGGTAGAYVAVTISFDDGSIACLAASRITHNKIREMQVTADVGLVSVNYLTQELLIHRQSELSALRGSGGADYVLDMAIERVHVRSTEPLLAELEHFVRSVRGVEEPQVTGHDALRAMRVVWEIQEQLGLVLGSAHG